MPLYSKLSDEELVFFFKNGDSLAFTALYDRYYGLLYIYACKIVGDYDIAKDLIQEVFIYLWDKREKISLESSISGYLYSSVRYKFFNLVDSQKVRADYLKSFQLSLDSANYSTENYITEKEFAMAIEREIDHLPIRMRKIFILSRREYLPNKEIYRLLGVSEKTVKNQVSGALKILRLKLGLFIFLLVIVIKIMSISSSIWHF